MKIIQSKEFKELLEKIKFSKEEYITKLQNINLVYETPFVKITKKVKDLIYYLFLVFVGILLFLLAGYLFFKNLDILIYIFLGLGIILLGVMAYFIKLNHDKKKQIQLDWYKAIKEIEEEKDKCYQEKDFIIQNIILSICLSENDEELNNIDKSKYNSRKEELVKEYTININKTVKSDDAVDYVTYYFEWQERVNPNEFTDLKQNRLSLHDRKASFLNYDKEGE